MILEVRAVKNNRFLNDHLIDFLYIGGLAVFLLYGFFVSGPSLGFWPAFWVFTIQDLIFMIGRSLWKKEENKGHEKKAFWIHYLVYLIETGTTLILCALLSPQAFQTVLVYSFVSLLISFWMISQNRKKGGSASFI